MKRITLMNSDWFKSFPAYTRRQLLRNWFELADKKGWSINVVGTHWEES